MNYLPFAVAILSFTAPLMAAARPCVTSEALPLFQKRFQKEWEVRFIRSLAKRGIETANVTHDFQVQSVTDAKTSFIYGAKAVTKKGTTLDLVITTTDQAGLNIPLALLATEEQLYDSEGRPTKRICKLELSASFGIIYSEVYLVNVETKKAVADIYWDSIFTDFINENGTAPRIEYQWFHWLSDKSNLAFDL
jgi:hypothetical protein